MSFFLEVRGIEPSISNFLDDRSPSVSIQSGCNCLLLDYNALRREVSGGWKSHSSRSWCPPNLAESIRNERRGSSVVGNQLATLEVAGFNSSLS